MKNLMQPLNKFFRGLRCTVFGGAADRPKGRGFKTDRKCHWKSSGRACVLKHHKELQQSLAKLVPSNPQYLRKNGR